MKTFKPIKWHFPFDTIRVCGIGHSLRYDFVDKNKKVWYNYFPDKTNDNETNIFFLYTDYSIKSAKSLQEAKEIIKEHYCSKYSI